MRCSIQRQDCPSCGLGGVRGASAWLFVRAQSSLAPYHMLFANCMVTPVMLVMGMSLTIFIDCRTVRTSENRVKAIARCVKQRNGHTIV